MWQFAVLLRALIALAPLTACGLVPGRQIFQARSPTASDPDVVTSALDLITDLRARGGSRGVGPTSVYHKDRPAYICGSTPADETWVSSIAPVWGETRPAVDLQQHYTSSGSPRSFCFPIFNPGIYSLTQQSVATGERLSQRLVIHNQTVAEHAAKVAHERRCGVEDNFDNFGHLASKRCASDPRHPSCLPVCNCTDSDSGDRCAWRGGDDLRALCDDGWFARRCCATCRVHLGLGIHT